MVGGRLACLGSGQYLKSRFGAQYEIEGRVLADVVQDESDKHDVMNILHELSDAEGMMHDSSDKTSRKARYVSFFDVIHQVIIPQLRRCTIDSALDHGAYGIVVEVEEQHGSYFRLKVVSSMHHDQVSGSVTHGTSSGTSSFDLAKAFALLEGFKSTDNSSGRALLQSYNVTQSSLEQIFIKMAAERTTSQHRAANISTPTLTNSTTSTRTAGDIINPTK
jgi:hypothetical protein